VICCGLALYLFVVHTLSARHPFFERALALDHNFVVCTFFGFFARLLLLATVALTPPLLQNLLGYSVFGAGLVMMPRGIGSFIAMMLAGRFSGRVDGRLVLLAGIATCSVGFILMSHFDLSMDATPLIVSGLFQGVGVGFLIAPLNAIAFASLDARLRPEAASVFTLGRNLGSSIGISMMQAVFTNRTAVAHADLAASVQPSNPAFAAGLPADMNPLHADGLLRLNAAITRQAAMVGYIDVFRLMLFVTLLATPLVFLIRRQIPAAPVVEID
jgi:DHA2 family multidrug resistance protein